MTDSPLDMSRDALRQIDRYKIRGKNRRDDGEYEEALEYFQLAVGVAEEARSGESDPRLFAEELSDLYGMMGGITRRQGLESESPDDRLEFLNDSTSWYDKGFEYERRELGVINSYNLVNRIICRILVNPSLLEDRPESHVGDAEGSVLGMLEDAGDEVERQLGGVRAGDPWALADRALVTMLRSARADAAAAYSGLVRVSPPGYVFESVLETLRPVASAASEWRPELEDAVAFLERRIGT